MFKWKDNLQGIDRLSAGALAAVMDLRRIGAVVIADRRRPYRGRRRVELFIQNVEGLTPELVARATAHADEIADLIYGQPRQAANGPEEP